MDSQQFIKLARQLVERCRAYARNPTAHPGGPGGFAADMRTAISRAYYGVYLSSQDLLSAIGFTVTEKGACHGAVHNALLNSEESDLKKVASHYGTLGTFRRKADYKLDKRDVEEFEKADELVGLAEKTYQLIEPITKRVRAGAPQKRVLFDSIKKWLDRDAVRDIWKT